MLISEIFWKFIESFLQIFRNYSENFKGLNKMIPKIYIFWGIVADTNFTNDNPNWRLSLIGHMMCLTRIPLSSHAISFSKLEPLEAVELNPNGTSVFNPLMSVFEII